VDSVRVWPRVGGTMTVRGSFDQPYFAPWAEVTAQSASSFTLRGCLFRVPPCAGCTEPEELPLPLDQARIGFTVIGKVDRSTVGVPPAPPIRPPLTISPNPMAALVRFQAAHEGCLDILDVRGRLVRTLCSGTGTWTWNGRDDDHVLAPPGVYFARLREPGARATRFARLSAR